MPHPISTRISPQIDLPRRRFIGRTLAGAALLPLAAQPLWAANSYPQRPIKWLVPYQAGTGPDVAARIMGEAVGKLLGQPIIVENRPGAAGNIGTRLAAKAAADGYTLLYTGTPLASNMRIYKNPGYDAIEDFRHILRISRADVGLIVHADSEISSLADLLARLRGQSHNLDYASGGVGTPSHLGMELFLHAAKVNALHVPYKGAGDIINAIIGKQVAFGMPIYSVATPLIKAGKLRCLATAGTTRNPVTPDVPTLTELGLPEVQLTSWGGLSAPKSTPDAIIQKLTKAFTQALTQPNVVASLEENGGLVDLQNEQQFIQSIEAEMRFTQAMMSKLQLEAI